MNLVEATTKMNNLTDPDRLVLEGKMDYKIYHKTYTDAIAEVMRVIKVNGYDTDENDVFTQITTGQGKPSVGKTIRHHLQLFKKGKLQRKNAHFQVYGMPKSYELNLYIQ